jgi:hypothetical protein
MTNLPLETAVVATGEYVSCDLNGDAAILGLKDGVYYTLDSVGARIWQLLQQQQTVRMLRDAVMQEYDVDEDRCENDLQILLHDLATHGLLTVAS